MKDWEKIVIIHNTDDDRKSSVIYESRIIISLSGLSRLLTPFSVLIFWSAWFLLQLLLGKKVLPKQRGSEILNWFKLIIGVNQRIFIKLVYHVYHRCLCFISYQVTMA